MIIQEKAHAFLLSSYLDTPPLFSSHRRAVLAAEREEKVRERDCDRRGEGKKVVGFFNLIASC